MASPRTKKTPLRQELERLSLAAFVEANKKAAEAKLLLERSRRLKATAAGIDHKEESGGPDGSIGYRRSAAKVQQDWWPFRQALSKRGLSVPDWARRQVKPPIGVETAKSWLKTRGRPRPCPEFWANRIAEEFYDKKTDASEVPAVDASWPHGIKRA